MKQKFNPKLTDRDSDEFKALEAKVLNKFKAGFEKIAADKGMTVDLSVSFEEVVASRKRRDVSAGDTRAVIDATYSSTDESTDLSAMESDLSGSVQASVAAAVTTTDGGDDLIDETASIEVEASSEVEGPVVCDGDAPALEDTVTVCSGSQQGIIVPICALETRGFFYETITMGDNADCLGIRTGDNVEFYTDDSNCAVSPTPNGTHIIYTSEIHSSRGMSNDIINRRQDLSMSWTCALEIDYMMSLTSGIATQMAQIEFELDDVEGTFEVSMGLWTDETFTTPSDGSLTITVPDSIYVGVVLDAADQFHSQLRKCWATPTSDPNDALNYPFIKDFCGDEMELYEYESLQIFANGDSHNSRFAIDSFAFTSDLDAEIYLHCEIRVCDSTIESCTPDCPDPAALRRKRRDADDTHTMSVKVSLRQE